MKQQILETQTPRVQWEKNGLVIRNSDIDPDDIFPKTTTDHFPEGASVRVNNQKKGFATVYFKGEKKSRTYGSGPNASTYYYCDETLKATLPFTSSWNKQTYTYSFTGSLPKSFTLDEMNYVLKYVRDKVGDMSGNNNVKIKDDEV